MTEIARELAGRYAAEQSEPMRKDSAFWDKTAAKYAASPIKDMEAYLQTMERTKAYLGADDRVLEVGCGTGSTALLLSESVGHLTATDFSAAMIEIANGKLHDHAAENVAFRQAPLPDPAIEVESFDAVLAFNILHLVRDLPEVICNLHRGLKPGGVFISKTVCLAEQNRLWAIAIFFLRLIGYAPHVRMLRVADVEKAIVDGGFEIVETGSYPAGRNHFIVARKI